MVERALELLKELYGDKVSKVSGIPCVRIRTEAAGIAESLAQRTKSSWEKEIIVATLLSDAIKETEITKEQIKKEFGDVVLYLIESQEEDEEEYWIPRKQDIIEHMRSSEDMKVLVVSLSNHIAQIRDIYRAKEKPGVDEDSLWLKLGGRPKEDYYWYYTSIISELRFLSPFDEYIGHTERLIQLTFK